MGNLKFRFIKTKNSIFSAIKKAWNKLSSVRIKPADAFAAVMVIVLSCLVIVPSIFKCAENRAKAACEMHMYRMLGVIAEGLENEAKNGGAYWQDLIVNGNYQKLLNTVNNKTGESAKYPSSDYYIRGSGDKISIICKKHKDISEKELSLSAMQNVNVSVAEKPMIAENIVYLSVSGPDTYYQNDSFDLAHPDKMKFTGSEVDDIIQNLRVSAVYAGGAREELPRSRYTITTETLDMSKSGQTRLIIKSNPTSVWDNSAYVPFIIDVIGKDDIAPLIVDGGINGRYELAQWEWSDFVEEASTMEDGGEIFGASIIQYNGKYYYYPDGLHIINSKDNTDPFTYALDTEDETKSAYYIEFDTNSVILNSSDEKKIHNGSLKVENGLIYIWQDKPSKELPEGWIRVYCEVNKY